MANRNMIVDITLAWWVMPFVYFCKTTEWVFLVRLDRQKVKDVIHSGIKIKPRST